MKTTFYGEFDKERVIKSANYVAISEEKYKELISFVTRVKTTGYSKKSFYYWLLKRYDVLNMQLMTPGDERTIYSILSHFDAWKL